MNNTKHITSRHGRTHLTDPWHFAVRVSIGNAFLFFSLSMMSYLIGVTSIPVNAGIAVIFLLGSSASFILLMRGGGALASLSYYVLGTGVFFGFGTFWSTVDQGIFFQTQFGTAVQERMLSSVNLLNSLSVLIVLVTSGFFPVKSAKRERGAGNLNDIFQPLISIRLYIVLFALAIMFVRIITFPFIQDALLRNLMTRLDSIVLLAIVVSAMNWTRSGLAERCLLIFGTFLVAAFGLISLSKTITLLPIMAFVCGLGVQAPTRKMAAILSVGALFAYFSIIAPLANFSRRDNRVDDTSGTIALRMAVVADTWRNLGNSRQYDGIESFFTRFSIAPFQVYLMDRYDEGNPGSSLADAEYALVPRILWPEKPNITRFGGDFYLLFFSSSDVEASSALAPSYTAEAYWNYGWLGLIAVSVIIGLEVSWLTQKWFKFLSGGAPHIGILFFAVPVILDAVWVENWIAATYVGGFVTLLILIEVCGAVWPTIYAVLSPGRGVKPQPALVRSRRH